MNNIAVRPKILIVDFAGSGGIAHYTYALVKSLAQLPLHIIVVTTKQTELQISSLPCDIHLSFPGHTHRKTKIAKGFYYSIALVILICKIIRLKPSIVHIQESKMPYIDAYVLKIVKFLGAKVVLTLHDIHTPRQTKNRFFKKVYSNVDQIIVHSERNKEFLKNILLLNRCSAIQVIPHGNYNFLAEPVSINDAKKYLHIPANCKIILLIGYISFNKGVDVFIDAFENIGKTADNVVAVIAGKPVDAVEPIIKRINDLGLQQKIYFRPEYIPIDELKYYLSSADMVVLPYRTITQSGMAYLAYAYGKPVVATAVGGLPDIVRNNETGLLVPPDDPDALADAMHFLLKDMQLAHNLGRAGHDLMKTEYEWDNIARRTKSMYENMFNAAG